MEIITVREEHLTLINKIARETWYDVYANILSVEQIEYMLEWMYSINSIRDQTENQNHHYLMVKEGDESLGFISYELNYRGEAKAKVHKIYVLPGQQKKGIGKLLIDKVVEIAKSKSNEALLLNMNKQNNAVHFYEKMGFRIVKEEYNDIGNGFVMDDYVLEKDLTNDVC